MCPAFPKYVEGIKMRNVYIFFHIAEAFCVAWWLSLRQGWCFCAGGVLLAAPLAQAHASVWELIQGGAGPVVAETGAKLRVHSGVCRVAGDKLCCALGDATSEAGIKICISEQRESYQL